MTTSRVAFVDFWDEVSGAPVTLEAIADPAAWAHVHLAPPGWVKLAEGVGWVHRDALEDVLRRPVQVVSSPSEADLLVCSCFGSARFDHPDKKKIYLGYEPHGFGPDPRLEGALFLGSTLSLDPSVLYLPLPVCYAGFGLYDLLRRPRPVPTRREWKRKTDALAIVSNPRPEVRSTFLTQLGRTVSLHGHGGARPLSDARVSRAWFDPRLPAFVRAYKVMACLESAAREGYHTEKIFHAVRAGILPVYWGDPRMREILNPEAYVDVGLLGPVEALRRIRQLCRDYDAYVAMASQPLLLESSLLLRPEFRHAMDEAWFKARLCRFVLGDGAA